MVSTSSEFRRPRIPATRKDRTDTAIALLRSVACILLKMRERRVIRLMLMRLLIVPSTVRDRKRKARTNRRGISEVCIVFPETDRTPERNSQALLRSNSLQSHLSFLPGLGLCCASRTDPHRWLIRGAGKGEHNRPTGS